MNRSPRWWCAVAALALVAGGIPRADASEPRTRFQWWRSERFQKELVLSADQVARIDAIFQVTLPELRQRKEELDRLEQALSRLIDADADEMTLTRSVDKTEAARSNLNKTRTLMLVRMRQVLTADQRVRFSALHEEHQRWRRSGERAGAPPKR